jgi:hypothetical protein
MEKGRGEEGEIWTRRQWKGVRRRDREREKER